MSQSKKSACKLLVLYVGGTIGMHKDENGALVPKKDSFVDEIRKFPELHDRNHALKYFEEENSDELILPSTLSDKPIIYLIKEYSPLLDSSNMSPRNWIEIVQDVKENYHAYNGFVILHGTDTLAYTASALSFMLEGLEKPVIVTGSQIPIFETRSDARDNFYSSLILAAYYRIPEVCVFFAHKLFRGNRTAKASSNLLNAFYSPNYHVLAKVGIQFEVYEHYLLKTNPKLDFCVCTELNPNVGLLPFFPTINYHMLKAFLKAPIEGVVLQSYGAGNIPSNREDVMEILENAVARGVIIVNVTQCPQGSVDFLYEPGIALKKIGIIPGFDMTVEAALTKLAFVLGLPGLSVEEKKQMMMSNLRGELTMDSNLLLNTH